MASTQIEIALADDDRKRIDRLCRVMLVNTGKPYLQSLDLAWHLSHKLSGAIADAKANARACLGPWNAFVLRFCRK